MKINNINKLNYIDQMLISLNHNNFSLILIFFYLIITNYYIKILIILITFLLFKVILKNNNYINSKASIIKIILISIFIYYLIYIYFINYVLLTVEKVEDHIIYLKDMVPFHHKHYKTSKMTNMENNTTVISGDAPTNINVVNIHCSLESEELFSNFFYNFENLVFNISYIFYLIFISILLLFLIIKLINFIKFVIFIKRNIII